MTATADPFRHEALLYANQGQFVQGAVDFLGAGLAGDEQMLVVLGADKIELLRRELGGDADRIQFADMARIGANPARIIAAWREFADQSGSGGPFRGIGEPIWAGRGAEEIVECQRHEALLNLAFADTPAFRLLCPYDTQALGPDVVEEAHRSHPYIVEAGRDRASDRYRDLDEVAVPCSWPLAEPSELLDDLWVQGSALGLVRRTVLGRANALGFAKAKMEDFVLAVNEVVTNSLIHGGGRARLRLWHQDTALVCEVRDGGRIGDPLAGRFRPTERQEGGRGIWLATQLSDLIQIRSFGTENVVRLHLRPS